MEPAWEDRKYDTKFIDEDVVAEMLKSEINWQLIQKNSRSY